MAQCGMTSQTQMKKEKITKKYILNKIEKNVKEISRWTKRFHWRICIIYSSVRSVAKYFLDSKWHCPIQSNPIHFRFDWRKNRFVNTHIFFVVVFFFFLFLVHRVLLSLFLVCFWVKLNNWESTVFFLSPFLSSHRHRCFNKKNSLYSIPMLFFFYFFAIKRNRTKSSRVLRVLVQIELKIESDIQLLPKQLIRNCHW